VGGTALADEEHPRRRQPVFAEAAQALACDHDQASPLRRHAALGTCVRGTAALERCGDSSLFGDISAKALASHGR